MRNAHRLLAALLTVLLITSAAVGGVAAQEAPPDDTEATPADEAYVEDDGDVVLVYHGDADEEDELSSVEYGINVSESIAHALVVSELEETPNATGEGHLTMLPNRIAGNGSLTTMRPENLESLTADVSASSNSENAKADASLDATFSQDPSGAAGLSESATFGMKAELAPETFSLSGNANAEFATPLGEPTAQSYTITESDGSYTVEVAQNRTVYSFSVERWNTSEAAKESIEMQYASLASQLGGSATVTIDSYDFEATERGGRLDIEYTVEYENIDEGLKTQVAESLADSRDYNLTEAEAETIGQQLADLSVDRIAVDYRMGGTSLDATVDVQLSNYEGALKAATTLAGSVEESEVSVDQLERIEQRFEARRAAGLTETVTLNGSLASEGQGLAVETTFQYRTENWAAYVSELENRGIDTGSSELTLHAETQGDEIVTTASVMVEQDQLLREATNAVLNSTNESDSDTRRLIKAFQSAGFRKAKMDVSVESGQVRIEAGAAFTDLAAVRDAVRATNSDVPKVASMVGRTENGTVTSYVRVAGAVDANASESEVRDALAQVDADTEVHLAGSYNRTFPEMDVEGARDYLGIEETPTPTPESTQTGQPGFGAVAALLALLSVAVLARRRQ